MAIVQRMSGIANQLLKEAAGDRHLWSPSYYVERNIGTVNEQAVAKYIDDQRRKKVNLAGMSKVIKTGLKLRLYPNQSQGQEQKNVLGH